MSIIVDDLRYNLNHPLGEQAADEIEELEREVATLQAKLEAAEKDAASKQAEIDRLMLEYCPNEMTPEQMENWAANQALAQNGKE